MARVTKIDNGWKKRFERMQRVRVVATRNKLIYFLIVCEGEKTEPNYFKALEKDLPVGVVDVDIEGAGRNTIDLVNYTIQKVGRSIRRYDRVWIVFDRDDFPDYNFNAAVQKAEANNINSAWSNEAFELWFLLHFQYVNVGMKRQKYHEFLEREIRKASGNNDYEYKKNAIDTYDILKIFGNEGQAIVWAKTLAGTFSDARYATHNPCTFVFKLIEELKFPQSLKALIEATD